MYSRTNLWETVGFDMNYVLIPFEQSPLDKIWETTCRQKSWTSYLPRFLRFWVIINKSGPQLKQFLGRAGSVGQDAAVCLRLFKNDFFFFECGVVMCG